jgi:hypothetical protein
MSSDLVIDTKLLPREKVEIKFINGTAKVDVNVHSETHIPRSVRDITADPPKSYTIETRTLDPVSYILQYAANTFEHVDPRETPAIPGLATRLIILSDYMGGSVLMLDNTRYNVKLGDRPHKDNRADAIGGMTDKADKTIWDTFQREADEEIEYPQRYGISFPLDELENAVTVIIYGGKVNRTIFYHFGYANADLAAKLIKISGVRKQARYKEVFGMAFVPADTWIRSLDGKTEKIKICIREKIPFSRDLKYAFSDTIAATYRIQNDVDPTFTKVSY